MTAAFLASTNPLAPQRCARLGLFDHKLVQKPLYGVVDELAAVVGMKATNTEGKLHEHRFVQWNQP